MTAGEGTPEGAGQQTDRGLLDTSVFIAREGSRPLGPLPKSAAISVITLAELHLGVLMATDPEVQARRLGTLSLVESTFEPLPIDPDVARTFAELASAARREGRRPKVMDLWIAATAVAHRLPVYTQDDDFTAVPQVRAVKV